MIEWTISEPRRLVDATIIGRALPEHFEAYLSAVTAAGAMPYRKRSASAVPTPSMRRTFRRSRPWS